MAVSGLPSRLCITVYDSMVAVPAACSGSASSRLGMASISSWGCACRNGVTGGFALYTPNACLVV